MKEIIYSLIIPHKNGPALLQRLLDTIPMREDLQVIIVDDNSDANIVDFSNFPGLNRSNTEVYFEKAGKGAGYSRNIGLSHAKGKWLLFADSDDEFTDNLNMLLDKYSSDADTDLVILNAVGISGVNNQQIRLRQSMYIENFLKKRFYSEKVLRYGIWTPWSRMVKRELVEKNSIRYEEIPTGNDMMFCLNCSKYAKNITAELAPVYKYYMPVGRSLTASKRLDIRSLKPRISLCMRATKLYKEVGYSFISTHIIAYAQAIDCPPNMKKKYRYEYRKILKEYNYCLFIDIYRFIKFCVARLLNIV